MTLIEMARKAGALPIHGKPKEFAIVGNDAIKAFAAIICAEREKFIEEAAQEAIANIWMKDVEAEISARKDTQ